MQILMKFKKTPVSGGAAWLALLIVIYLIFNTSYTPIILAYTGLLASLLVWVCVADTRGLRIPNLAVVFIFTFGFIYTATQHNEILFRRFSEGIIVLVILYAANKLLSYSTRKATFGFGDIKLLAASTMWVGLTGVFQTLFIACILGLLVIGALAALKKRRLRMAIPFGPFISVGLWVVWLSLAK